MLATMISGLAIFCSASVAATCAARWWRLTDHRAAAQMGLGAFSIVVALLNLSALFFIDMPVGQTAMLAYLGFATAILLPLARALTHLTYEAPGLAKRDKAAV